METIARRIASLPPQVQARLLNGFSAALSEGRLPSNLGLLAFLKSFERGERQTTSTADKATLDSAVVSYDPALPSDQVDTSAFSARHDTFSFGVTQSDFMSIDRHASKELGRLLEQGGRREV